MDGPFIRLARPSHRDWLGKIQSTVAMENHLELVLGTKNRSGKDWDAWEAVYSPQGDDGYPKRLWDKKTGVIDQDVAAYWRENFDLRYIMERDWATLGPKLEGKISVKTGANLDSSVANLILNIQRLEFKQYGQYRIDLAIDNQIAVNIISFVIRNSYAIIMTIAPDNI